MTIREAAKELSERMSHRIGPASVMNFIMTGELGCKDMTKKGAKRRRLAIQPEHIDAFVQGQSEPPSQKRRRIRSLELDPRVRC